MAEIQSQRFGIGITVAGQFPIFTGFPAFAVQKIIKKIFGNVKVFLKENKKILAQKDI
jgi:hypothetical protein